MLQQLGPWLCVRGICIGTCDNLVCRDQHGQHPQHSPRPHHGQHSKQQHPQQQRRGQQQQQQQAQQHTQAAADGAQLRQEQQQQQHYSSRDVQQQQRQGPRSSGGGGEADGGEGGRPSSASRPAVAAGRGRQVANHLLNFQYETRGPPRVSLEGAFATCMDVTAGNTAPHMCIHSCCYDLTGACPSQIGKVACAQPLGKCACRQCTRL